MAIPIPEKQARPMELEGSLSAFSLPEILQFLSMGRMTGMLTVIREDYRLEISIMHGKVVGTRASHRESQIGQMLVNRGFITAEALSDLLDSQKTMETGKKIGEILLERKALQPQDLRACLRAQMEEEIWTLFGSAEGQFKFEHRQPEAITPSSVELAIESLIMEGTRRQDEWRVIEEVIPAPDTILAGNLPFEDDSAQAEAEEKGEIRRPVAIKTIRLSPKDWELLTLVDGFTTVSGICQRSPYGKFDTYCSLNNLIESKFLRVKGMLSSCRISQPDFQGKGMEASAGESESAGGAARDTAKSTTASSGFRALFSKSARPATAVQANPSGCLTAVSLAAQFTSDIMKAYAQAPEFGWNEQECRLQTMRWFENLMARRDAELLRWTGWGIDAALFDRFAEVSNGIAPELEPCAKACQELVTEYCVSIIDLACQRLGLRQGRQIAKDSLDAYQTIVPRYGGAPDWGAIQRAVSG
ncbi:MAG: DUF4388 domain-containing protein [Candidatus Sumerlaeota bacterium]|nr:DUF4388 domain-containing protein [Candidatus Sumerlaeota bacterium]